jgi:hypothetical protein
MQVQHVGAHAVEELAVVRDHHQHAGILQQPLFQPQHGVEVEVIGRLVEQQQVARHHQRARQIQAHAPAAGEFRHRTLVGFRGKAQAMQQLAGARGGVVAVDLGQASGAPRPPRPNPRRQSRLPRPSAPCTSVSPDSTKSIAASGSEGVSCATLAMRNLGTSTGHRNRLDLAEDRREQAGLAATVAADHAHAPTGVQGNIDLGQQQALAAPSAKLRKEIMIRGSGKAMLPPRQRAFPRSRAKQGAHYT